MTLNRWQVFFGSWALFTFLLAPIFAGFSVETAGGALIPAIFNLVCYRKSGSIFRTVAPGLIVCAMLWAGALFQRGGY